MLTTFVPPHPISYAKPNVLQRRENLQNLKLKISLNLILRPTLILFQWAFCYWVFFQYACNAIHEVTLRQDRDKTGRHLDLALRQDTSKKGPRLNSDLMNQDRDMTVHKSDLSLRQYTDKTGPRSDCDLETGQRQDRALIRSRQYTDKTENHSVSDLEPGQRHDMTPNRSSLESVHR